MVTNQEIWDETRYLTMTDEETLPDVDLLRGSNILQREMFQSILAWQGYRFINEDLYTHDLISTVGLSAGDDGYNGEYSFDSRWVKVTGFELLYDAADHSVPAKIYDRTDYGVTEIDEDFYNGLWDKLHPAVRFQRDSYAIRPTNTETTVPDGIRVWAESRQSDMTDADGIPIGEENFMQWYTLKLALRYGKFRPGVSRGDVLTDLLLLEKKAAKHYQQRFKLSNKSLQPAQNNFE